MLNVELRLHNTGACECSREVQQGKPALRDIFSSKCLLFVENNQIAISRELGGVTSCARDMLQP